MSSEILLSICIPTFNRPQYLKVAVESVLAQIDPTNSSKVEIVISDNSLSDESQVVIEELKKRENASIKYYKNEHNVGFDGNCLLAVERASGRYAWLLGDDDLLAPGALEVVLREIGQPAPADLYLGEKQDFYLTPDRPMRYRRIMELPATVFDFRDRQVTARYFRTNKKLVAFGNYLSIVVFDREQWRLVPEKDKYVGTGYIHLFVFWSILWGKTPRAMKYLPQPLVKRRWGNDGAPENSVYDAQSAFEARLKQDVLMYRLIATAVFREPKYIRRIDELVLVNDGFSWAVRTKLNDRRRFYRKIFPLLWSYYRTLPLFWLKIVPLLFIPNFMLRVLRGGYRVMVKGERLDLRGMLEK